MKNVLSETRKRMEKSVESFTTSLSTVRTGRANPVILNRVMVNYYGSNTPLNQLASVSSPDARTLHITPYDKSAMDEIERAIRESDLGFNPSNQGDTIFITVPALNDERRRDLVRSVHAMAEDARVSIRNIRRDGNDMLREMEKETEIGEDDLRRSEADVQKLTDEFTAQIDKRVKSKEEDILAV